MPSIAKLFTTGRSQAVRLPKALIAAHAVAAKATLVTHDRAFSQLPDGVLGVEDWVGVA